MTYSSSFISGSYNMGKVSVSFQIFANFLLRCLNSRREPEGGGVGVRGGVFTAFKSAFYYLS